MKNFDGTEVVGYRGRFATPFEMDDAEGSAIRQGDIVHFIVRTRVTGATHSEDKSGDLTRTNKFSVTDVMSITEDDLTKQAVELFLEKTKVDFGFDVDGLLDDSVPVAMGSRPTPEEDEFGLYCDDIELDFDDDDDLF